MAKKKALSQKDRDWLVSAAEDLSADSRNKSNRTISWRGTTWAKLGRLIVEAVKAIEQE